MWSPTQTEAIDMFARHFEALHRSGSVLRAKQTADRLRNSGDFEGHAVWNEVADRIEGLRKSDRVPSRRQQEAS